MRKNKRSVPKHILAAQVFSPMYGIIKNIEQGEVEVEPAKVDGGEDTILLPKWKVGNYAPIRANAALSVQVWCETWAYIAAEARICVPTTALEKLAAEIHVQEFYAQTLVAARKELDEQYRVWRTLCPKLIAVACDKAEAALDYPQQRT